MSANNLVHIIDDDDALRDSLAFLLSSAAIDAKSLRLARPPISTMPSAAPRAAS